MSTICSIIYKIWRKFIVRDLVIGKQDAGREFIEIVFNTTITDNFLKNFTDKLFSRLPHFREFMYKSPEGVYIEVLTPSNLHIGYKMLKKLVEDIACVSVIISNAVVNENGNLEYWRVDGTEAY